jgi:TRAP-type C4-dicarboxylate transport system permease small subunit
MLISINRAISGLNWLIGWLLAALLLVMTVLIAWQVFARYVMGSPLHFSEEIARFSMVWMTMLGAAYAFRYGTLISVDVLSEFSGRKVARVLDVIVTMISCVFAYVLIVEGLAITQRVASQVAPSTRVSMAWLYAAIPAGAVIILINAIGHLIDDLLDRKEQGAVRKEEVD